MAKTPRAADLGAQAESAIAAWYAAQGYELLARNWRAKDGELDVVVRSDDVVVVVEVKARSSARFGTGLDAITPVKVARLYRVGRLFLHAHGLDHMTLRIDVASWVDGTWNMVHDVRP